MAIEGIGGTNFSTLELYAEMTGTEDDDKALGNLNQQIMDAVPDATPDKVGEAIDRIKSENPNWTMDQVFEAAIKELNPGCKAETINQIRSSWQDFTGVSNLSANDIGEILVDPITFVINNDDTPEESIKNIIAMLMLLMIDIAGEESADQLLEGCMQRDEIMDLAKDKAKDIRIKAVVNLVVGLTSATIQVGGALGNLGFSSGGLWAAGKGKTAVSQSLGGIGSSISGGAGGLSTACNSVGSIITGMLDADIAEKEGKSQAAGMQKDTADKLKQKAIELIQAFLQLLQSMAQAEYQTMTAIGRV